MSAKIQWSERLEMLMACASPGSALAYYELKANLVRRDKATDDQSGRAATETVDRQLDALVATGRVVALP